MDKNINEKLLTVSEKITQRIRESNGQFFCNDNISAFIDYDNNEIEQLVDEVAGHLTSMLKSLVIDIEHDHNTQESARRIAKMFVLETFNGRYSPVPRITSFPNVGYRNLYVSGPISIRSTCAHHFQNITGNCWVGILPESEVIGLSKFNRLVHWIAHRPQIQEEMTTQIADMLVEYAKTPHVAVVVKAEHSCMTARGVREHDSDMSTAIMRGNFLTTPSLKEEFYSLLRMSKGHSGN